MTTDQSSCRHSHTGVGSLQFVPFGSTEEEPRRDTRDLSRRITRNFQETIIVNYQCNEMSQRHRFLWFGYIGCGKHWRYVQPIQLSTLVTAINHNLLLLLLSFAYHRTHISRRNFVGFQRWHEQDEEKQETIVEKCKKQCGHNCQTIQFKGVDSRCQRQHHKNW